VRLALTTLSQAAILDFAIQSRERNLLPSIRVEIRRIKPALECRFSFRNPGCSQQKTKSVIPGKIVVSSPNNGAMPKLTIFIQKSLPNSPGLVLVT
jgi:hypothetical protein